MLEGGLHIHMGTVCSLGLCYEAFVELSSHLGPHLERLDREARAHVCSNSGGGSSEVYHGVNRRIDNLTYGAPPPRVTCASHSPIRVGKQHWGTVGHGHGEKQTRRRGDESITKRFVTGGVHYSHRGSMHLTGGREPGGIGVQKRTETSSILLDAARLISYVTTQIQRIIRGATHAPMPGAHSGGYCGGLGKDSGAEDGRADRHARGGNRKVRGSETRNRMLNNTPKNRFASWQNVRTSVLFTRLKPYRCQL